MKHLIFNMSSVIKGAIGCNHDLVRITYAFILEFFKHFNSWFCMSL